MSISFELVPFLELLLCLLESGQKTLTEVAEFLKSVLKSHTRTEMGEDNLSSANQSRLQKGKLH